MLTSVEKTIEKLTKNHVSDTEKLTKNHVSDAEVSLVFVTNDGRVVDGFGDVVDKNRLAKKLVILPESEETKC